ncbi:unnamed protein product [Calicophoron daubneyi]|uniref:Ketoreductase domain-containing protein n=1 Tax=Calicophoron daubneyi TaxID=300641 RepID=A0AAV2T7W6_CALDB
MEETLLSEKVALITGASSGIGKATAILFAKLGARLALVGRNEQRLTETASACLAIRDSRLEKKDSPKPVLTVTADLANTHEVESICSKVLEHFHEIDILVNCAGIAIGDSVENVKLDQFDRVMATNVRAAVLLTNLLAAELVRSKAVVVNVSSALSMRPVPQGLSYCMSKAALDEFTKCAALCLGPKGVRVNSVVPGGTDTPMLTHAMQFLGRSGEPPKHNDSAHKFRLLGEPEEVARAIAFLASPAASFINGALLPVDGGFSAIPPLISS